MTKAKARRLVGMNTFLWSIVLTMLGALLVAGSLALPVLAGAGLLVAAVGVVIAMFALVTGLEERPPGDRRRAH